MIRLNQSQVRWLENIYNKAFVRSADNNFAIRFAAKVYNATRFNPNFESPDGNIVGIAALPADTPNVDVRNTEESLNELLDSDFQSYIANDGDLTAFVQESQLPRIEEVENHFNTQLFGDSSVFTGIDNPESRFKLAMRNGSDLTPLKDLIGELVNHRVTQRNSVIGNA